MINFYIIIIFTLPIIYFLTIIYLSDEGVTKTFTCARPLVGQHVFLQLVGVEGSLSLCEVEVFTTEGMCTNNFQSLQQSN